MAQRSRRIATPHTWQASAREVAMTALRKLPAYDGFLLSLRQRWSATQIPPMSARFFTVRVLESIQRVPGAAGQVDPDWDIQPSDDLRAYLGTLDNIVARHLHLTVDGAAAWWVKQVLHEDAIKHTPPPYHGRADVGEGEAPQPAPVVKITTEGYGVRVTLHDPATDAHLWHDDPATGKFAHYWVFADVDAAVPFIRDTLTQHNQAQKWQHNAASEAKMLKRDIPALMRWYVAGDCPADEPTRRRLHDLARDVLMLDPPPNPRKTRGNFFADLAKKGGYDASNE